MIDTSSQASEAIAEYKALLRTYLDRRPSGTRQKLAEAYGTPNSYISQIINPSYRVPLPAQHIPALFRVCHLSPEEQRAFLDVYARAHPGQFAAMEELASFEEDVLRIPMPKFSDPAQRKQVEQLIKGYAERIVAIFQDGEKK
jgi:hypothetical protein